MVYGFRSDRQRKAVMSRLSGKRSGNPFASYKNFKACIRSNKDKRNPEGYCASIKRRIEGKR